MDNANTTVDILDIRNCRNGADKFQYDFLDTIVRGLKAPFNAKTLPMLLLYDERGLQLFDKITTDAPEYYIFGAEVEILQRHAPEIAQVMQGRSPERSGGTPAQVLLELGAGALRKTSHILHAFANLPPGKFNLPSVTYFALDLEEREIERNLIRLHNSDVGSAIGGKIETKEMLGTYDDGVAFILQGGLQDTIKVASANNVKPPLPRHTHQITPRDCSSRLSASNRVVPQDTDFGKPSIQRELQLHLLFIGCSIGNFPRGEDAQFLRLLPLRAGYGDTLLLSLDHNNDRKEIETAYKDPGSHRRNFAMNGLIAAGTALGDSKLFDSNNWEYTNFYDEGRRCSFSKDELIRIMFSLKYTERDANALFTNANLRPIQRWTDSTLRCSLWLLERPIFAFPLLSSPTTPSEDIIGSKLGVPSMQEWQDMWNAWDFVALRMIPSSVHFEKRIDLRQIRLFYLGHIPTFLDIHISHLLQEPRTQSEESTSFFEKGIDPNVDDPTQCQAHSGVPQHDEDWPSLNSVLSIRERVRDRLTKLYMSISSGAMRMTSNVARVLILTYEHEALHIETLLYMLLQRVETLPPPGFATPPWESLLSSWNATRKLSFPTIVMEATTVNLGIYDVKAYDTVKALEQGYVANCNNKSPSRLVSVDAFKISWRPVTNSEFFEFYTGAGKEIAEFPASWVKCEDGEIRVRTFYGPVSMSIARDWPVLTSYDTLAVYASAMGGRLPSAPELRVFMDKFECGYEGGANIGFRNWHPVPATTGVEKWGGQGHNGGVWEWTSTISDRFELPRHPSDVFHDTHHRVVLGGSFVTIPRIAERQRMRKWYHYYTWVGARIVYNV